VLQYVAVYCSMLQCVAVSVILQCVVLWRDFLDAALECVSMCYSVLQCGEVRCSELQ